jgi:hypothetical protein
MRLAYCHINCIAKWFLAGATCAACGAAGDDRKSADGTESGDAALPTDSPLATDNSSAGDSSNASDSSSATDGSFGPDGSFGDASRGDDATASIDATRPGGDARSDASTGSTRFAVLTNRYDNGRTGANTSETTLSVASVRGGTFGLRAAHPVDGQLYAQPLYLPELVIDGAQHNVVFVATEHDTVYAFDADATQAPATDPLWTRSLGTPMNAVVSTNGWKNPLSQGSTVTCGDMFPKSGVTSTPVIDRTTGRMYVEGKFFEGGKYSHRLYALDVLNGRDVVAPVTIEGSVPGTGFGAQGGSVAFDSFHALNRPGLLLMDGNLYVAFGSHCDDPSYHGWVFAYDAGTLAQKGIFNTTPAGVDGGLWQSGIGLIGDSTGVFFSVGNGDFDSTNQGVNFGLSVVRLQLKGSGLTAMDWWTPTNAAKLNAGDQDLTGAPVLLPKPRLLVAGGKDGNFYVIDPANMGRFNAQSNKIVQQFQPGSGHIHGGPVYWNGPAGPTLYMWSEGSPLRAFQFAGTRINTTPVTEFAGDSPTHPGGILSLSSNGATPGTGVLWATFTSATIDPTTSGDAWHNLAHGVLYAFDASNLTTPIWKSSTNPADDIGIFAKFNPPIVANGKVYLGTQAQNDGGRLLVYGASDPSLPDGN